MMYYSNRYYFVDLFVGMVLKDVISGDIGVLVNRYDVMSSWEDEGAIWAWDILWTGPCTDGTNRNQPYTETGLLGMINAGRMEPCNAEE